MKTKTTLTFFRKSWKPIFQEKNLQDQNKIYIYFFFQIGELKGAYLNYNIRKHLHVHVQHLKKFCMFLKKKNLFDL